MSISTSNSLSRIQYPDQQPQALSGAAADAQHMDENPELLERIRNARFDTDDPPPYRTATEANNEGLAFIPTWAQDNFRAEVQDVLSKPLSDAEFQRWVDCVDSRDAYNPINRYNMEADHAHLKLRSDRKFASVLTSDLHFAIAVRHIIKQRWQKLGVWNSEWDIPEEVKILPNMRQWRWSWQRHEVKSKNSFDDRRDEDHPNYRAAQTWRDQLRDRGRLPPRSKLSAEGISAQQAEAWLISRPWYLYLLEAEDESVRQDRIRAGQYQDFYEQDHDKVVKERWAEKGEWAREWGSMLGWTWLHESPLPSEAEFNVADLTPSEADAWEGLPAPTAPPKSPAPASLSEPNLVGLPEDQAAQRAEWEAHQKQQEDREQEQQTPEQEQQTPEQEQQAPEQEQQAPEQEQQTPVQGLEQEQAITEQPLGPNKEENPEEQDQHPLASKSQSPASEAMDDETSPADPGPNPQASSPAGTPSRHRGAPKGPRPKGAWADAPRRSNRVPIPVENRPEPSQTKPRQRKAKAGAGSSAPLRKGRGRPKNSDLAKAAKPTGVTKRRGRPSKNSPTARKPRGRPPNPASEPANATTSTAVPKKKGRPTAAAEVAEIPLSPAAPAKGRGRPSKKATFSKAVASTSTIATKKRGRPSKPAIEAASPVAIPTGAAKRRGRPPKQTDASIPAPEVSAPSPKATKPRGRPAKKATPDPEPEAPVASPKVTKSRGRPSKQASHEVALSNPKPTPKTRGRPPANGVSAAAPPSTSKPSAKKQRGRPSLNGGALAKASKPTGVTKAKGRGRPKGSA
ncbi:hypothetical protein MKZ38_008909 [Zalerion maritima]|uniref:Uncharacterized protein n=1 Tax=Zalerion maritima TaxID=339359 RepID=A0AAD5RGC3_9PEZI|nr:hypothetical protein MKZ38_008909 [Zalerion maritima]